MKKKDFIEYLSHKYKFNIKAELEIYQKETQDAFQLVANFVGYPLEVLGQKSREYQFKVPRFVCMWYLWKFKALGLKDIGFAFGGRDHSTVINARDIVDDSIVTKDMLYAPYLRKLKPLIPEYYWDTHLTWLNETAAN